MVKAHSLAQRQQDFMAHVLEEGRALPAGWSERHAAGLDIYRNAYRARLVDALRETYERTAKWVGEDGFRQAAAHHLINRPPSGWTLDDAGDGFPETLTELFTDDPAVAELAWLEWAMHRAYVAADAAPMLPADLEQLAASFSEEDWVTMQIVFLPGTDQHVIRHDIGALWAVLEEDSEIAYGNGIDVMTSEPAHLVVWRESEKPVFMPVTDAEGRALQMMRSGSSYGAMCEFLLDMLGEDSAIAEAGAMLGRWLHNGLIASISK